MEGLLFRASIPVSLRDSVPKRLTVAATALVALAGQESFGASHRKRQAFLRGSAPAFVISYVRMNRGKKGGANIKAHAATESWASPLSFELNPYTPIAFGCSPIMLFLRQRAPRILTAISKLFNVRHMLGSLWPGVMHHGI